MAENIKCPDCGASNPVDTLICGLCGKNFVEKTSSDTSSEKYEYREEPASETYSYDSSVEKSPDASNLIKPIFAAVIIIGFICFCAYSMVSDRPIRYGPGIVAPDDPIQKDVPRRFQKVFTFKEDIFTCMAEFDITARVLHRERYYLDEESKLAPVDLAMGWGIMSDEQILDKIDIGQTSRFYYWSTDKFPIPRREIETKSANMHIIPANDQLEDILLSIRQGHIVHIKGYLVWITGNNSSWNSSLTRNDTGDGACEVIYAEEIQIIDKPQIR